MAEFASDRAAGKEHMSSSSSNREAISGVSHSGILKTGGPSTATMLGQDVTGGLRCGVGSADGSGLGGSRRRVAPLVPLVPGGGKQCSSPSSTTPTSPSHPVDGSLGVLREPSSSDAVPSGTLEEPSVPSFPMGWSATPPMETPPSARASTLPVAFSRLSTIAPGTSATADEVSEPHLHLPSPSLELSTTPNTPAVEGAKPSVNSNPFVRPSYRAPNPQVMYFRMGGGTGFRVPGSGRLDHGGQWMDAVTWPMPFQVRSRSRCVHIHV